MEITRIKNPKFKVGRFVLNEYELRQLQLEVAQGLKPSGLRVTSLQNGVSSIMQKNGKFETSFGEGSGYDIGSFICIQHWRLLKTLREV